MKQAIAKIQDEDARKNLMAFAIEKLLEVET